MHLQGGECQEADAGTRVIKEESIVAGDQTAGVEEVTALKQRHATTGNSSVSRQPVGLTEYRCDVYIKVYRLQAVLQF